MYSTYGQAHTRISEEEAEALYAQYGNYGQAQMKGKLTKVLLGLMVLAAFGVLMGK